MNQSRSLPSILPTHLWLVLMIYVIASLMHFVHNAEFIGFYPNMPSWITRQTVYYAWLVVSAIGVLAITCMALGLRVIGIVVLMAYGATGFDGLGHYALALCSQHSFTQNFTIWFEVITGALLLVMAARQLPHRHSSSRVGCR